MGSASRGSVLALWGLLGLPGTWWTVAYATGGYFYGRYVHLTGLFALQLFILALAITPLTRLLPGLAVNRWLRQSRRYFGVASFCYASLHMAAYCLRQPPSRMLEEALAVGMGSGWVALLLMLALALTSNDASVRTLGRCWKALHRLAYPAAALSFAHWIVTAFDPTAAYTWLALLVGIELTRLLRVRRSGC